MLFFQEDFWATENIKGGIVLYWYEEIFWRITPFFNFVRIPLNLYVFTVTLVIFSFASIHFENSWQKSTRRITMVVFTIFTVILFGICIGTFLENFLC